MAAPSSSSRLDQPDDWDAADAAWQQELAEARRLDRPSAPAPSPLSVPIQSARPGARIWLLDPDQALALQLQRLIEACGWQCLPMHNSTDLEAFLANASPDALVLEQLLPQSSGCQLLERLRGVGHRFPVVMLSSQAAALDRIRGLEAGADDYLAKPCAERELMLRLERLLLNASQGAVALEQNSDHYRIADLQFDPADVSLSCGPQTISLSRGDAALLVQFCQSPGLILSREQLARGSGSIVDVSNSRSLDMRISKLRRLLTALSPGLGDQLQAVRGRGYRLVAPVQCRNGQG